MVKILVKTYRKLKPKKLKNLNSLQIDFDENTTVFFSYSFPVGFRTKNTGLVIRENSWGNITEEHLQLITEDYDENVKRLSPANFKQSYSENILHPLDIAFSTTLTTTNNNQKNVLNDPRIRKKYN